MRKENSITRRGSARYESDEGTRALNFPDDAVIPLSRERIAKGSRSFSSAARLFPPLQRDSATMLYAWCRHCDDEIDGQELGHNGKAANRACQELRLAALQEKTADALAGRATDLVFIGLHRVMTRHAIPHHLPYDLLEGMGMDVRCQRYGEINDTLRYAYHVAGCVGLMMAMIMGVREDAVLARACDLGIAFQLTNIVRDIVVDAGMGRVYLPATWLAEEGMHPDYLADPANRAALVKVAARVLDLAEVYYASSVVGISQLPFRCACAVAAARRIYRGIGTVVRARGEKAWDKRASISRASLLGGMVLGGGHACAAIGLRQWQAPVPRIGLWTPSRLGGG